MRAALVLALIMLASLAPGAWCRLSDQTTALAQDLTAAAINLITAKALGLMLLARADEVIEW